MRTCFHCQQEIKPDDPKTMRGLDRPYANLWFHRTCLSEIDFENGYLVGKFDKILEYISEMDKNKKK